MNANHTSADLLRLAEVLREVGFEVVEPSDWANVSPRWWNGALCPRPLLLARCDTTEKVSRALRVTNDAHVPISIYNGGQDWAGRSLREGTVILDISRMAKLAIDADSREVMIGGGVTAAQLNQAAGEHGLAAVIGNDGAVSMTGLVLGGGYGPLMTRFGLACDSLLSAEVVLPDGRIVVCDAERNADLFWALRGGGGNFGVVTAMRLRLYDPGTVLSGTIVFPLADARAVLARFADVASQAPANLFASAVLSPVPDGKPVVVFSMVWSGEVATGEAILARVGSVGTPLLVKAVPMPASSLLSLTDGKLAQGRGYEVATRWFDALGPATIDALVSAFEARTSPLTSIIIHHCHGAATDVAPEDTAFGMRKPHFTALIYATWTPERDDAEPHRAWAHRLNAALSPTALPGGYANLLPDTSAEQIACAYGPNAARLASVKEQFNPSGVLKAIPLP
ncbi:hypothetical protein OKW30_006799 [Paraburkholderia sp. Clong3]|uniref:FAD-binding oxidoreductase n=1 Tax=unclassified Paraburkholderia TaxID=2615204 RepID=UPI00161057F1|nr:FAD-binding oxidoreductase [Paraburkholderia sp. CI2]MBB5464211.1 hypothetical protein [Paraburkholderia sp. CI2]